MSRKHMSVAIPFARLRRDSASVLIACLLIITSPLRADDTCNNATLMDLNSSLRSHVGGSGSFLVELEAPAAGILSVDAAAPITPAADPGVVITLACLPRSATEPIVLERSAGHQVLAVDAAGPYVFRVASQDARRPAGELKLRSAFVADDVIGGSAGGTACFTKDGEDEEEIEIDSNPFAAGPPCFGKDGEDEEEIEIDSNPFAGGTPCYAKDGEDEEEIEIDSNPFAGGAPCVPPTAAIAKDGEDEEEIEIDSSPLVAPGQGSRSLHAKLDQLCRSGEVDDHGDSLTCATFLSPGRSLPGEIYNGWGDDADVFHFVLDSRGADPWTVVIETAGGVDTAGALYDGAGQRLNTADQGGRGDNFRIVRSLRPGAYYVRVEGREGAEGLYAIGVSASR